MKALILGAGGQLGRCLRAGQPDDVTCIPLTKDELDITNRNATEEIVANAQPTCIINAAAYTAVDKAEDDAEQAFAINGAGTDNLARAAKNVGARLIHISTDYVFDGKAGRPYRPDDTPNPLNVYGRSKLAGEEAVRRHLPEGQYLILRTAWVYTLPGKNFPSTILRLLKERDELNVVCDQIGTPTSATGLARAVWRAADIKLSGTHHWTDAGVASWYDFAVAIRTQALGSGLLTKKNPIHPVTSDAFPTRARRLGFGVLDKQPTWTALGVPARHWASALRAAMSTSNGGL